MKKQQTLDELHEIERLLRYALQALGNSLEEIEDALYNPHDYRVLEDGRLAKYA